MALASPPFNRAKSMVILPFSSMGSPFSAFPRYGRRPGFIMVVIHARSLQPRDSTAGLDSLFEREQAAGAESLVQGLNLELRHAAHGVIEPLGTRGACNRNPLGRRPEQDSLRRSRRCI